MEELLTCPPFRSYPEARYAVIFCTQSSGKAKEDYASTSRKLVELVSTMPGYLGIESVRDEYGRGISISYWTSVEAIQKWKENPDHLAAQQKGKSLWYQSFSTRVCRIDRENFYSTGES